MKNLVNLLDINRVRQELGREPGRVKSSVASNVHFLIFKLADQLLLLFQKDLLMQIILAVKIFQYKFNIFIGK